MDTLELCCDLLQPGGRLETPGLVIVHLLSNSEIYLATAENKDIIFPLIKGYLITDRPITNIDQIFRYSCIIVLFADKYF